MSAALTLNAEFVQTQNWYAMFLLSLVQGRLDDALEYTTRMGMVDPLSGYSAAIRSLALVMVGRFDESIDSARVAVERAPESFLSHWFLQLACLASGRLADAIATGRTALALSRRHGWAMAATVAAHAQRGEPDEARVLHDELVARSQETYVQGTVLAWSAAALGLTDEAISQVDRAVREHDPLLVVSIGHWPFLERLRQVLREAGKYDAFLIRLGLA